MFCGHLIRPTNISQSPEYPLPSISEEKRMMKSRHRLRPRRHREKITGKPVPH